MAAPPTVRSFVAVLSLVSCASLGCGGPGTGARNGGHGAPPTIDDENVANVERAFWRMDPEDEDRIAWRDALIAHFARGIDEVLERGDYDAVVLRAAQITSLLLPRDIEHGQLPNVLRPLAEWIIAHGAPRGDEGRVMASHLLLALMGEEPDQHRAERERIAAWGRGARATMPNPMERYGGMIQVWEQHEELAPAPEVLAELARLYVEQRDGLIRGFGEGEPNIARGLSFQHLRLAPVLIQRAPLDVAAVYLRHGDLDNAVRAVQAMGAESGVERQLLRLIEVARENNGRGAEALAELSQGFAEARPQVSAGLCRVGARRFERDARFPICLARAAFADHRIGAAVAWYEDAVRLAPDEPSVYGEALEQLDRIFEGGEMSDIAQARSIAGHALSIVAERDRRWPERATTDEIRREMVLFYLARAEMNAGNVEPARTRLQESLQAAETLEAHALLGVLCERTGDFDGAAREYRAALDRSDQVIPRAQLTEHLGDAFRRAGRDEQARRMYRQALSTWDDLIRRSRETAPAFAEVRRGILLDRVGDRAHSIEAFTRAIEAAPRDRQPYAEILTYLVSSSPNLELAQTVLRRAQFQLTLEAEWKVYFALWVQTVAARASVSAERDVHLLLDELASGEEWPGRLAAFAEESIDYPELRELAGTRAHQMQSDFYEATRRLREGDTAGAREMLDRVLASNMVAYVEFEMAQDLVAQLPASGDGLAERTPAN
ncbi:MAG: tetratricopeptide repeat protein [Sandaracinaceae bacterium]